MPVLHAPTGTVAGRFPPASPPAATPEDQHDEYHACQRGNRRQPRRHPAAAACQAGNYAGQAWCLILMNRADAASSSWKEQIMMNLVTVWRSMAKLQYTAVRQPFTLLDERVVAPYWHDQGLFRLGFQRFLGSADELAG